MVQAGWKIPIWGILSTLHWIHYEQNLWKSSSEYSCRTQPMIIAKTIGVVAIGTLGTQALPNKERNLSIRNQKVFKYWAQYKEISSKFKWIVLNLGHQQLILLSSQYCTWNISNRSQEREKVPSLENASTTPMSMTVIKNTLQIDKIFAVVNLCFFGFNYGFHIRIRIKFNIAWYYEEISCPLYQYLLDLWN